MENSTQQMKISLSEQATVNGTKNDIEDLRQFLELSVDLAENALDLTFAETAEALTELHRVWTYGLAEEWLNRIEEAQGQYLLAKNLVCDTGETLK